MGPRLVVESRGIETILNRLRGLSLETGVGTWIVSLAMTGSMLNVPYALSR